MRRTHRHAPAAAGAAGGVDQRQGAGGRFHDASFRFHLETLTIVIPAKAGIHALGARRLDSGFRRNDEIHVVSISKWNQGCTVAYCAIARASSARLSAMTLVRQAGDDGLNISR